MSIKEQLRAAIQAYRGPITGDSIEAVWFRQAGRQLLALDAAPQPPYPFCRTPDICAGKGYCPQDPACND